MFHYDPHEHLAEFQENLDRMSRPQLLRAVHKLMKLVRDLCDDADASLQEAMLKSSQLDDEKDTVKHLLGRLAGKEA